MPAIEAAAAEQLKYFIRQSQPDEQLQQEGATEVQASAQPKAEAANRILVAARFQCGLLPDRKPALVQVKIARAHAHHQAIPDKEVPGKVDDAAKLGPVLSNALEEKGFKGSRQGSSAVAALGFAGSHARRERPQEPGWLAAQTQCS